MQDIIRRVLSEEELDEIREQLGPERSEEYQALLRRNIRESLVNYRTVTPDQSPEERIDDIMEILHEVLDE